MPTGSVLEGFSEQAKQMWGRTNGTTGITVLSYSVMITRFNSLSFCFTSAFTKSHVSILDSWQEITTWGKCIHQRWMAIKDFKRSEGMRSSFNKSPLPCLMTLNYPSTTSPAFQSNAKTHLRGSDRFLGAATMQFLFWSKESEGIKIISPISATQLSFSGWYVTEKNNSFGILLFSQNDQYL